MVNEFIIRIGTYFLLLGAGLLILFIASDLSKVTNYDYLFWSIFVGVVGILLRRRKAPPPPSGRFSIFRRGRPDEKDKKK